MQLRIQDLVLRCALVALSFSIFGCGDSSQSSFVATETSSVASPVPSGPGEPPVSIPPTTQPPVAPQAPTALNDSFTIFGNSILERPSNQGLLANDTVNEAVVSGTTSTAQGGTVEVDLNGSFRYTPPFGFTGTDAFAYTLSNATGQSTAVVTIEIPSLAYFVDNSAGVGGNGSEGQPFSTLASAINIVSTGDTIVVARGDGSSTGLSGAVNLPEGVDLIGTTSDKILAQTSEALLPRLTGPINCGGDNTVSGLLISGSSTVCVEIADSAGEVILSDNVLADPELEHVLATELNGNLVVKNNLFREPGDSAYDAVACDTTSFSCNIEVVENTFDSTVGEIGDLLDLGNLGPDSSVTFNDNTATETGPEFFDTGVTFSTGSEHVTLQVRNNEFDCFEDDAVFVSGTGTVEMSVTGNLFKNIQDQAVQVRVRGGSCLIESNTIDSVDSRGLDLEVSGGLTRFAVRGNRLENGEGESLRLATSNGADAILSVTENFFSTTADRAVSVIKTDSSDLCLDFSGNTLNQDLYIEALGMGDFFVEQLDLLESINTFSSGAVETSGTLTSVADDYCETL